MTGLATLLWARRQSYEDGAKTPSHCWSLGYREASRHSFLNAIAGPADDSPLVTMHADGAQIYECKADAEGKLGLTVPGHANEGARS